MIRLFREARQLQDLLDSRNWPFCFIGGIAVQHWGEPRVTRDIDLSIFTGFGGESAFIDVLLSEYSPRIPHAREFALQNRVLLIATRNDVPVDVVLAALPLELEIIRRAVQVDFVPDVSLRICSAEDLFVLKAFANRDRDRADLTGIARRHGTRLDWDGILERLRPLAEAKQDSAIVDNVLRLRG